MMTETLFIQHYPYYSASTVPLFASRSGADPGFFGKGVRLYKGMGVRFADFIIFFLNMS